MNERISPSLTLPKLGEGTVSSSRHFGAVPRIGGGWAERLSELATSAVLLILLQVAFVLLSTQPARAENPTLPLYINAGGNDYMATDGTEYLADQAWVANGPYGHIGGVNRNYARAAPLIGSEDRQLLDRQHVGWEEYRVGPLPAGDYVVTLTFVERTAQGPDQSVFDLRVEDETVISAMDLFGVAGLDRPYTRRFLTQIDDGYLNISATPIAGQSKLAALSVLAADEASPTPAAPQRLSSLPSYNAAILTWRQSPDSQIEGYHLYRSVAGETAFQRITTEPLLDGWFADRFFEPAVITETHSSDWTYRVTAIDLFGRESAPSTSTTVRPRNPYTSDLPVYELEITAENLAHLRADIWSYDEVPAILTADGLRYAAEVRFRGHVGRTYPKKSWKIIFRGDSPIAPRDRLNLRSQYEDASLLRGELTTWVYQELGIEPPQSHHVLLFVNGEYAGLFNDFEQVDAQFLERSGRNAGASIYGTRWTRLGNWGDLLASPDQYRDLYVKQNNTSTGYADLIEFVEALNYTNADGIAFWLAKNLDVQRFLDYYVGIVLAQNMDFTRHNVFLVHDHEADRWEIIPWDPDYTWGTVAAFYRYMGHDMPIDLGAHVDQGVFNGPNRLLTRVLDVPQYRSYYCNQLEAAKQTFFTEAQATSVVDVAYSEIEMAGMADWHKYGWASSDWFEAGPDRIKAWVGRRRNHLADEIERYCQDGSTFLTINEVMSANESILCDPDEHESGDCYDPWIEIYNAGLESASLQGLYLSTESNASDRFRINATINVPSMGHALLWLDGEREQGPNHANFRLSPQDKQLFLYDRDGETILDTFDLVLPPPDRSWGRFPDGAQHATLLTLTSPGSRNRSAPIIELDGDGQPIAASGDVIEIATDVADDGQVHTVDLHYSTGNDSWQSVRMNRQHYGRYAASIPGQLAGTLLTYYITAEDDEGLIARVPSTDPSDFFVLEVGEPRATVRISRFHVDASGSENEIGTDWIELHNFGAEPAYLDDLFLTNNERDPTQHRLPANLALDAGAYLIFLADGDVDAGPTHLNFTLSHEGGLVALYQDGAEALHLLDSHRYGNQANPDRCQGETTTWITSVSQDPDASPFAICFNIYLPLAR